MNSSVRILNLAYSSHSTYDLKMQNHLNSLFVVNPTVSFASPRLSYRIRSVGVRLRGLCVHVHGSRTYRISKPTTFVTRLGRLELVAETLTLRGQPVSCYREAYS